MRYLHVSTVVVALGLGACSPEQDAVPPAAPGGAALTAKIRVKLVGPDGQVVRGAVAHVLADLDWGQATPKQRRALSDYGDNPEALVTHLGEAPVGAAEGDFEIDRPSKWAVVVARRLDHYGKVECAPEASSPVTLVLKNRPRLQLRVVDARGHARPGIGLRARIEREGQPDVYLRLGATDDEGHLDYTRLHVRLEHFEAEGERVLRVSILPAVGRHVLLEFTPEKAPRGVPRVVLH